MVFDDSEGNPQIRQFSINFNIRGIEGKSFDEKYEVYEYYEKIINDIRRNYPTGIKTSFQVPYDQWAYLSLEKSMFRNAMGGMACSILFAFVILLLTTKNLVVSFYSVVSISLVIATIMSAINLLGWSLGIAESIGLIVFIGFSVDYIVHMSHQYVESVFDKRKNRVDSCF